MKKRFLSIIIFVLYITGIAVNAAWYDSELAISKEKGFVSQLLYENPEKFITRAEVCDLLVSYYEYMNPEKVIQNKPNNFTDIENSEYKTSIEKAYSTGIINGVTETLFAPDENITREQFVTLVYRMNGSPMAETFYYEDNDEISEYAFPAIDYSVKNKIVMGTSKGYFSPKENITNAQAIVIVNRLVENFDSLKKEKTFSGNMLRSETEDYICYITRRFDVMGFWLSAIRGIPSLDRPFDQLVIIDKRTDERKIIELRKIVSLYFFDIKDKLYIPICRITSSQLTDTYNEGMYIVDKITGNVEEITTPVIREAFAFKDNSIYYFTNAKTKENTIRPTISKYNLLTKEITMSKQPCIGDFEADFLLYLDETEAVIRNYNSDNFSSFAVDLDTLEIDFLSKKPVFGVNKNYYIAVNDSNRFKADLYNRKTNQIIRTIDMEDEFHLVSESDSFISKSTSQYKQDASIYSTFLVFDVNGELYLRVGDNIFAECITNNNMFDIDYFYKFLNGYVEYNDLLRKDKSFFFHNLPQKSLSARSYGMEYPTTDAAVGTLCSRKIYGNNQFVQYNVEGYKMIREFCEEYKHKYTDPHQLVYELNKFLTYDCDYDYDTYYGRPVNRTYSAYSCAGIIKDKSGVCDGFAHTVKEVLQFAKIKCETVDGIANNGSHAWNVIEFDGIRYFIDSTWNSCLKDENIYYMISYDQMALDHDLNEGYFQYVD